jgi:hypothetical protein
MIFYDLNYNNILYKLEPAQTSLAWASVPHEPNRTELSQIRIRFGSNRISNLGFRFGLNRIRVDSDSIRFDSVWFGSNSIRIDSDSIRILDFFNVHQIFFLGENLLPSLNTETWTVVCMGGRGCVFLLISLRNVF